MFPITYVEPISPDQQMPALAASVPTESWSWIPKLECFYNWLVIRYYLQIAMPFFPLHSLNLKFFLEIPKFSFDILFVDLIFLSNFSPLYFAHSHFFLQIYFWLYFRFLSKCLKFHFASVIQIKLLIVYISYSNFYTNFLALSRINFLLHKINMDSPI
jgi:hypothetical protein